MKSYLIKLLCFLLLAIFLSPANARYYDSTVEVSVISDDEGRLRKYPVLSTHNKEKAYIEAKKGQAYGIRIKNNTANRVGVVIAVDGRNIISGKKSFLGSNERMYVLEPFESAEYDGWRTGRNQVNRFYFTKGKNSYAASWGDKSAMGVIAVAAFEEKKYKFRKSDRYSEMNSGYRHSAKKSAGTGFGEEEYSPSVSVKFKPGQTASFQSFLKYEWRNELCKKGVVSCRNNYFRENQENRFWRNEVEHFAPPPPRNTPYQRPYRKDWNRFY